MITERAKTSFDLVGIAQRDAEGAARLGEHRIVRGRLDIGGHVIAGAHGCAIGIQTAQRDARRGITGVVEHERQRRRVGFALAPQGGDR